ncbi:copper resistance CopC family protein [Planomonospora parontospora]|uniref:copper resistance CopC family protein n=1 Tax=Planomonospora parontospora TaxID=58119 RepID=UPI00167114EA|nr:copper resistance CopC family protein [Planomonospora parontospora]GGL27414.1 copper resistance protein C [Planomonospora parontospora subsp. antibiotica]GII16521.1 copper resistance protein C [Planomonospora parontospora subsp. antibiotica]
MRRSLTVLLLACAALLGAVAPAQAHNVLIGSDPEDGASIAAGPERITLTFDQPARQGFAQITLTGPDGTRWEEGKTAVDGAKVSVGVRPLGPAGEYVVGYRILSSDGHPVSGKVAFTLTAPGPGSAQPVPAASAPAVPAASGAAAQDPAENPGLSAQAAEAAQNGGAGMAVVWIAAALVLLGGATVVAMRRTRERTDAP